MLNVDEARDDLEKILSREEYSVYHAQSNNIFTKWWEELKEWVAEQLAKLFPSIQSTTTAAEWLLFLILAVVIILLVVTIFFIIRNKRRKYLFRENTPLHSSEEMDWSFQMHLSEAIKQENGGRYTPATRHLFLALLLYFHEKEWLEAKIWKTNWEYYEELKKVNRQWADQFYHLASFFDEATYGEREVEREEYIQFQSQVMNWLGESNETERR